MPCKVAIFYIQNAIKTTFLKKQRLLLDTCYKHSLETTYSSTYIPFFYF